MTPTSISSGRPIVSRTVLPTDLDDCGATSQAAKVAPFPGWCARLAIALAATAMFATSAFATEYQYLNARTNPKWRTDLLVWLQKFKPTPDAVTIGITESGDVHAYAVQGQFTGIYSIQRLRHPEDRASPIIRTIVDGGTGRIIGFGRSKAAKEGLPQQTPTQNGQQGDNIGEDSTPIPSSVATYEVYVLTWTKQ